MAANVLVEAGFLIALLRRRDNNHDWALSVGSRHPPPWKTCEAALSEAFFLLGTRGAPVLAKLLQRGAVLSGFSFHENCQGVLQLMNKYADIPISLADACLVRMTEIIDNSILLTTDTDFRIYRRHGRQMIRCVLPK